MKYSMTIAYAIQATVLVADKRSETPVSCAQIAQEGQMPERFLLRVLRGLVSAGILRSTRGSDGGYSLTRPPATISLLEIIDAVTIDSQPILRATNPGRHQELELHLAAAFARADQAARQEIKKLTVADLMASDQQLRHPA